MEGKKRVRDVMEEDSGVEKTGEGMRENGRI